VKRILLVVAAALVLAGPAAAQSRIVYAAGGELWSRGVNAGPPKRLTRNAWLDARPAVSADGLRIAFLSDRAEPGRGEFDLWVMNVDGSGARRLTWTGTVDGAAWAPDGRALALTRAQERGPFRLEVLDLRFGRARVLPTGDGNVTDPAWSPDGTRIAFALDRGEGLDLFTVAAEGGPLRRLTDDGAGNAHPAWAPSGRSLAFSALRGATAELFTVPASGGSARRLTFNDVDDLTPTWSPDGRRLAFTSGGALHTFGLGGGGRARLGLLAGEEPDWAQTPDAAPLFPDFDQHAPRGLVVSRGNGRWRLGFASAVANVGAGPSHVLGHRTGPRETMIAAQVVHTADGGRILRDGSGVVRYVRSPEHSHWHFLPFESYELRTTDGATLLVRDRKSGFCMGDRRGHSLPGRAARALFGGFCRSGEPRALSVEQGTSVGWVDRYPANYHGQFVDVTAVPPGTYLLVHRANPRFVLLETEYGNNAASLLIRISWPGGFDSAPRVAVLRVCQGSETCGARLAGPQ
jgi:hypothetical protein